MKYTIKYNFNCYLCILFTIILLCFVKIKCYSQTITHVTLTCYQPVKQQTNEDNLTTSDGSKINLNHLKHNKIKWCAISRDLLWLFPKGNKVKRVYIEGFGIYEVRDVMNKRHKHRIDLLIHPKDTKRICLDKVKVVILK